MKIITDSDFTENDLKRFWVKVKKGSAHECWLWKTSKNNQGYGVFQMPKSGQLLAHRVSFSLFNKTTDSLYILHKCDTPACVNPEHLFSGTLLDNAKDMIKKGRKKSGDRSGIKNPAAKLNPEKVRALRFEYSSGMLDQQAIALKYGISQVAASMCLLKKTWRNVI